MSSFFCSACSVPLNFALACMKSLSQTAILIKIWLRYNFQEMPLDWESISQPNLANYGYIFQTSPCTCYVIALLKRVLNFGLVLLVSPQEEQEEKKKIHYYYHYTTTQAKYAYIFRKKPQPNLAPFGSTFSGWGFHCSNSNGAAIFKSLHIQHT